MIDVGEIQFGTATKQCANITKSNVVKINQEK